MPVYKDSPNYEVWRAKIAASHKGKKLSDSHKTSISKGVQAKLSEDASVRQKIGAASRERWQNPEYRERAGKAVASQIQSPEGRERARKAQLKRYSDTEQRKLHSLRAKEYNVWNRNPNSNRSKEYFAWRDEVYQRDKHTCQACGSTENIVAHHIISWAKNIELRFDVSNGIVLCASCHSKHHHPKGQQIGHK